MPAEASVGDRPAVTAHLLTTRHIVSLSERDAISTPSIEPGDRARFRRLSWFQDSDALA